MKYYWIFFLEKVKLKYRKSKSHFRSRDKTILLYPNTWITVEKNLAERDAGDIVMLVTYSLRQVFDVGDRILNLVTSFEC